MSCILLIPCGVRGVADKGGKWKIRHGETKKQTARTHALSLSGTWMSVFVKKKTDAD